jgi:tRNA(Arg) A34 adenosine deaminase TadA
MSNETKSDDGVSASLLEHWMKATLAVANDGVADGQYPFAASIYRVDGTLITADFNTVAASGDVSEHGEVNAIRSACQKIERSEFGEVWLVSTAEPCPMCLATALIAGIRKIAYGAPQSVVDEAGFKSLGVSSVELAPQFKPTASLVGSVLLHECSSLLMNHRRD